MTHRVTPLTANWQMRPTDQFRAGQYPASAAAWLDCTIPNQWQQHPLLTDYVGRMLYRTQFPATAAPNRRQWLRLNGVFYDCRPWLNDYDLGRQRGYFMPHEYDVTNLLRADNQLLLEVQCPEEHNKVDKQLITGVFSHWDSMDSTRNPGGVWLPVELIESGPVRLRNVLLTTQTITPSHAEVRYRIQSDALQACSGLLQWRIAPHNFAGQIHELTTTVNLAAGQYEASGLLNIPDPVLWWSHDLGHPALYTVTATLVVDGEVSDVTTFQFGIRTFTMKNWIPYLNGQRFFMKGSNYAPTDVRLATVTAERCQADLQLARDCHMNVLRIHGHVAHPALYAAADAAGVMLWQDFPLQWMYHRDILATAQTQVRQMVELLNNHPAIVLWCMHNESFYMADTSDERVWSKLRTYFSVFVWNWNRNVLDAALQQIVATVDPSRPTVRSSGEYAVPLIHAGTDAHFYYGWYKIYGELAAWQKIIDLFPQNSRFVTEFGAQSFPNYASAVKFMAADLKDIDWATLQRKHSFQPDMLGHWRDWRKAADLQALIDMTQDYQIAIHRHYIDRLRMRKYRPTGGILPFMFHDANPAISWSIVDYWRVPKRSYAAMQLAFRPQYIFCVLPTTTIAQGSTIDIPISVVNDAHQVVPVECSIHLLDPNGAVLAQHRMQRTLPADCMALQIEELRLTPQLIGTYCVVLHLQSADDEMTQTYTIDVTAAKE